MQYKFTSVSYADEDGNLRTEQHVIKVATRGLRFKEVGKGTWSAPQSPFPGRNARLSNVEICHSSSIFPTIYVMDDEGDWYRAPFPGNVKKLKWECVGVID